MTLNRKTSVFIVDDDADMREMLKLILQGGPYDVVDEAGDGEHAVEMCGQFRPDLILLDINMPKMSGLVALERIRKISPTTKVVMVSGASTMDKVREAIQKGACGFIVKPLKVDSVLDKIREYVNAK